MIAIWFQTFPLACELMQTNNNVCFFVRNITRLIFAKSRFRSRILAVHNVQPI